MRMNCFDRRTLMVLSLTLSSGFSKSSAIVRPAEPALSWITLRLESFASYIHASYAGQERESCINKIRKIYENLLNISVYPMVILFPTPLPPLPKSHGESNSRPITPLPVTTQRQ